MAQMSGMAAATDPEGYYRTLGVPPSANHEAIVLAYRTRAKILHPDVPGTGDASQFLELQAAYEVLGSRKRREAYDRAAREPRPPSPEAPAPAGPAKPAYPTGYAWMPGDEDESQPFRRRRRKRVPLAAWLGLSALVASAALVGLVRLLGDGGPARVAPVPALPPLPGSPDADPGPSAAAAVLPGAPTDYVAPSAATDDATLWRYDGARGSYVPTGRIAPFAPVQLLRTVPGNAMAEIRQSNGHVAYIEAARLVPGDQAAAGRADCTFNAGLPPENGEVLRRSTRGPYAVRVENLQDMPSVVQLRTQAGVLVAEVFVAANSEAAIPSLPAGSFEVQVASGEFWSRHCSTFTAAMRAQRRPEPLQVGAVNAVLTIPRNADGSDVPNEAFWRD